MRTTNPARELWCREYRRIRCMARGLRGCHDKSLRNLWQNVTIRLPGRHGIECSVRWSGEHRGSPSYGISCGRSVRMRDYASVLVDQVVFPYHRRTEVNVRRMMLRIVALDRRVCRFPDRTLDFSQLRPLGSPISTRNHAKGPIEAVRLANEVAASVLEGRSTPA